MSIFLLDGLCHELSPVIRARTDRKLACFEFHMNTLLHILDDTKLSREEIAVTPFDLQYSESETSLKVRKSLTFGRQVETPSHRSLKSRSQLRPDVGTRGKATDKTNGLMLRQYRRPANRKETHCYLDVRLVGCGSD